MTTLKLVAAYVQLAALNLSSSFVLALLATFVALIVLKMQQRWFVDKRLGINYGWSPSRWMPLGFELTCLAMQRENPNLGNCE